MASITKLYWLDTLELRLTLPVGPKAHQPFLHSLVQQPGWMSKVLAIDRRRHRCFIFSHWPSSCSVTDSERIPAVRGAPDCSDFGLMSQGSHKQSLQAEIFDQEHRLQPIYLSYLTHQTRPLLWLGAAGMFQLVCQLVDGIQVLLSQTGFRRLMLYRQQLELLLDLSQLRFPLAADLRL